MNVFVSNIHSKSYGDLAMKKFDSKIKHLALISILPIMFVIFLAAEMRQREIAPAKQIWQVECSDGWLKYESVNRFSPEQEFRMCSIE